MSSMTASSARQELLEHWPLMAVAFLLVFFAFGVPTYSLPFIYDAATQEQGWSSAQVNLLATARFLIGAAAALGMGLAIDKMGGRWTVLIGAAAAGTAMALFLFATNLPVYYAAGALGGFSAASILAAMTCSSRYPCSWGCRWPVSARCSPSSSCAASPTAA